MDFPLFASSTSVRMDSSATTTVGSNLYLYGYSLTVTRNGLMAVKCGNDVIGDTLEAGGDVSWSFANYYCRGNLNVVFSEVVDPSLGLASLLISSPTNMSTNTPYVSQVSYDHGIQYSYSPALAQIGYGFWIVFSVVCVYALFKFLK